MSTILTALNASAGMDKNVANPEDRKASPLDEKLLAAGVPQETLTEAYGAGSPRWNIGHEPSYIGCGARRQRNEAAEPYSSGGNHGCRRP